LLAEKVLTSAQSRRVRAKLDFKEFLRQEDLRVSFRFLRSTIGGAWMVKIALCRSLILITEEQEEKTATKWKRLHQSMNLVF
jgi:hypothetical protein